MSFFPQGTFFGVDIAGSALSAFTYAESVTASDIANVNTPGASRQQVIFNESPPIVGSPGYATNVGGTSGDGVLVQTVQRVYSESYTDLFRGANAAQNYYSTEQTALTALQSTLGDPNTGVGASYANFQAAVNQLDSQGSTGSAPTLEANVISAAQALAGSLNGAASAIQTQQTQAIANASSAITTVNSLLDQIAALNGSIRATTAAGDTANTYSDQRDNLIDQLSQYLTVQTSVQADGSTLVSVNGQALVNDTVAYHLTNPTVAQGTSGSPTFQINFQSSPNGTGIPLGSGELAADQDLYNSKMTPYLNQLNAFASGLANEVDRVTQSGYNGNAQPGDALFQANVPGTTITASNISVGPTDPNQLSVVLASTAAGTLVVPMNSANNTVDTTAQLTNYASLQNPPAGALAGTLTVTVNGVAQAFNYNTTAGQNSDTVNDFVTNFNSAQLGVTASFNPTSQSIVFTLDPSNESLALRAAQGSNPSTPSFTISDSNSPVGSPATSLLGVLGAGGIQNVAQNASNAYGQNDNGVASGLLSLFGASVGVPAVNFSSATTPAAAAGVSTSVALPIGATFSNTVPVGQVLTLDAGTANQENVTVTGISFNPANGQETVTFTPANAHLAGYNIQAAQTQTLGQYYGTFITQVGLDGQTAVQGTSTQTTLANNLDQERQSISGINIDEETQNLIEYQNAYSAAARVLNVLNQNLGTIITGLGVGG